jgi:cysteine desulfurase/selenocysteine lyase
MYSLLNSNYFKKRDEIIISISEHHANLVSWQYLAKKLDLNLKFINLNDDFTLDLEDLKSKLSSKTKLVALNHISNTLGIINNIKKINKIVKNNNKNTLFLVDASQSAPHIKIDFKDLNIDFLCFTAHKMLGPTGLGILVAKQELLEKLEPCRFGGDMIKDVNVKRSLWNDLPNKFEAGTPHIAGAFGLSSAIDYLEEIGLKNIHKYDQKLLDYALDLLEDSKIELYNFRDKNTKNRSPIILFGMDNMDCRTLSALLDESENIATRAGVHCAQPIINKINKQGVSRASFYLYNTTKEIDLFVNTLKKISKI